MSTLTALVDDEWMAEWMSCSTAAVGSDQLAEYTDGAHTWVTTATPDHDRKWREEVRMKSHLLRYDRTRGPVPISPTAWRYETLETPHGWQGTRNEFLWCIEQYFEYGGRDIADSDVLAWSYPAMWSSVDDNDDNDEDTPYGRNPVQKGI